MKRYYQTGDAPLDEVMDVYSLVLPNVPEIVQAVTGAIASVSFYSQWEQSGNMSVVDTCDYIKRSIVRLKKMNWAIGVIVPFAGLTIPANMLLCDGSTYFNESYSQLASVLGQGGSTFTLPDLTDTFILGASLTRPPHTTGGQETVILTTNEMPSHSHGNIPHAHSEVIAVPTIINGGIEAPASSSTPSTSLTSATDIEILSTGGGQAHENMPPFYALRYCIIAELFS